MNREEVILKVEKILALAKNNPNENEAISATLKAQKLMSDYNISSYDIAGVKEEKEKVIVENYNITRGVKIESLLGTILAESFRCILVVTNKTFHFHGYLIDVDLCLKTYDFLSKKLQELTSNYIAEQRKVRSSIRGLKESYQYGFLVELQKQLEKQSNELMIITPKEVHDNVEETYDKIHHRSNKFCCYDKSSFKAGSTDARNLYESGHINSHNNKQIEG